MKKIYLVALFAFVCNFAFAQLEQVSYQGAFAPGVPMWTDQWTNWNPQGEAYPEVGPVVNITADISANTTFVVGTTYKLTKLVYVRNNAILTIQPGVVVKGLLGSALIVTKGAKLNAIGTAALPIIFTSDKSSGSRAGGDWGGVVLLGKARFSALTSANTGVNNIEGISATVDTEYGGGTTPNDADSSGTLRYVRIEYGGYVFSPNNEINGLTMGACGSGTVIDYVQVSHANDDSFEWFGGAVNCKHLVAFRGLDDDFDADNGYKGAVQFALGVKDPGFADNPTVSNSEGFETDNNPAGVTVQAGWDNTTAVFSNCTLIGPSGRTGVSVATGHERALRLRRGVQIKIFNSIFMDFKANYVHIDGSLAVTNFTNGLLKFKNNIIAGVPTAAYPTGIRGNASGTSAVPAVDATIQSQFLSFGNVITPSAGVLVSPYNITNYNDYNLDGVTIDYRPGAAASNGASFTDATLAALLPQLGVGSLPIVANLTYCQGATGLPALTAQLTTDPGNETTAAFTGVSLRWYTSATTATFTTTAPIPTSGTVGTKTFFVAQVSATGVASARVPLMVTILARPTVGLGAISGVDSVTAPTVNVGSFLGTATQFTYTVVAQDGFTVLWTVPNGVNVIADASATDNSITVNYLNVPGGAGFVGTILAQSVNAAGCPGVASKLTIKKALAAAPALKMFNTASAKPTTALTSFGQFAGTTTSVTLTATNVTTATGYQWELPSVVAPLFPSSTPGVNVTPVTTTAFYTAEPFTSPVSPAPTSATNKYWAVTSNTYNGVMVNGVATKIVTSTARQFIVGNSRDYTFTIPTNSVVNVGDVFTYNGGTFTYRGTSPNLLTATTVVLRGTGSNLLDALLTNVSDVLTKSVAPIAGDVGLTISFTRIQLAVFYGASTSAPYAQYGTVVTSDLPSILVSFAGAGASTVNELYLGVKSLNGTGASVTNNNTLANAAAIANNVPGINYNVYTESLIPAVINAPPSAIGINTISTYSVTGTTPSTARLLKVVSVLPLAPASIKSLNVNVSTTNISTYLGTTNPLTLTCAAVANASSYTWNLPLGVNIVSATSNTNTITVNYAGVAPGTASVVVGVRANNNIDTSLLERTLTLTAGVPSTPGIPTGTLAICPTAASSVTYTIALLATRANEYVITVPAGCTVDSVGSTATPTTTITIPAVPNATFTVNYPSGFVSTTLAPLFINIASVNGFGNNLANRILKLTNGAVCGPRLADSAVANAFSVVAYPNPSSSEFTIETSAKGAINVNVYDMQGRLVEKSTSTQVGSRLAKGVYNVVVRQGANTKSVRVIKN